MIFGEKPLCNRKPNTAPHIGRFCFPLCWRCTSIIVGFFSWYTIQLFAPIVPAFMGIIMIIPCAVDGCLQYIKNIESSNNRRIITGLLCGFGFSILSISIA